MRNWKRRTRYQHRARLKAWKNSDAEHHHESKYVLSRIRKGEPSWSRADRGKAQWEAWWSPIWRKWFWLKFRRAEQHVEQGMALFAKYPYYEDCRYHICRQTKITPNDPADGRIDVEGESIINGTPSSCSYEHCGISHLSKEEGEERAEFARTHGMLPYQMRWVYATKGLTVEQNTNSIRAHMKQDAEWHFNKNGGTQMFTPVGRDWILETFGIDVNNLTPMTDEEMTAIYGE